MENEVLTCSQIAEELGISRQQVLNYIKFGVEIEDRVLKLPARMMSGAYRVFRKDLDNFLYTYYKATIFFKYFKM